MEDSDPSCFVIPNEVLQLLNPLRSWRAQLGPQAVLDTGEWSNVSGLPVASCLWHTVVFV